MEEIWKRLPIEPFNEFVEVSDKGSVRTIKAPVTVTQDGTSVSFKTRNKTHVPDKYGFTRYGRSAHLVARTFIGKCPDGYCLHFKDNNQLNVSVENLEYVSCNGIIPTRTVSWRIDGVLTTRMPSDERIAEVAAGACHLKFRIKVKKSYQEKRHVQLNVCKSVVEAIRNASCDLATKKKMYWEYVVICQMRDKADTKGKQENVERELRQFKKRYKGLI